MLYNQMNMGFPVHQSYATPICNSTLLPLLLLSLARQKHAPEISIAIRDEYDYIIVGGGASGSVVASRLSEDPSVSVLVLEAGPVQPILTEVPALARYFRGTDVDWRFKTVPQRYSAFGSVNREILWPAGKMLGGSSSFNGMIYVRGNHKDYDHWAAQGAKGWSYRDVRPYFLKLEDNRSPAFLANGYHVTGGPITVEQPRYQPRLKQAASAAAIGLGYPFVDPNAATQTGFYDLQANFRDSQRCNSVKGYLVPAAGRKNLDILVNAMVTQTTLEGRRAAGVKFFDGRSREVKAKKEVILAAGVDNTPKILMLSGIGPRDELRKFNIPVVADLPVGRNFHGHGASYYFFTMDPIFRGFDEKLADAENILEYIRSRSGPLASAEALLTAFLNGTNRRDPEDYPNHQIYIQELPKSIPKSFNLKPEVHKQFFGPYENRPIFTCSVQNLHPRSRGTVTLKSADPFEPPEIDPNYLEVPTDVEDFVDGLKNCKTLLQTEPMLRLGAKPFETLMPGCEVYAGDDDQYFRCYVRMSLQSFCHSVGTTKMGCAADPTTVVDPQLRVKNVSGLRVVDASVMPTVPSGNTHIPVLMVAEKASDIIRSSSACF